MSSQSENSEHFDETTTDDTTDDVSNDTLI